MCSADWGPDMETKSYGHQFSFFSCLPLRSTEIELNDWKNCCWVGINLFIGAFRIFGTLVLYLAFWLDSDYGYGEWSVETNSEVSPSPRLADWRPPHLAPATFHSGEIVMNLLTLPTLPSYLPPLPLSTYKLFVLFIAATQHSTRAAIKGSRRFLNHGEGPY